MGAIQKSQVWFKANICDNYEYAYNTSWYL